MICWKCGKENEILTIGHSSECSFCNADLHSCKGCKFYSEGRHFDCCENISEPVADKERANFCDFFMKKSDLPSGAKNSVSAKNAAAALFGEVPCEDLNNADNAKKAFNSLFGE